MTRKGAAWLFCLSILGLAGFVVRIFVFQKISIRRDVRVVISTVLAKKNITMPLIFSGGSSVLPNLVFLSFVVVVVVVRHFSI